MKVTYKWLQEHVDIHWTPEELADKLTQSGSEVESVDPISPLYNNVLIGTIESSTPHPDSSHLKLCHVDLGKRKVQIICGAPNVKAGLRVPVALPGAQLPQGVEIKKVKIRGIESDGMICSEYELGLSAIEEKIMELSGNYKPGCDFIPLELQDDIVLDVFINPNRPDCMSVRGIAREIAALSGKTLRALKLELPSAKKLNDNQFSIEILDSDKCSRYCGAIITGIQVKPSPFFVQQRLFATGIRPVNNIVDATNYCLIELGQPLHAFDLHLLKGGKIVVQTAKKRRQFITLDNEQRTLNNDVLMICDEKRAVAIGGIMGGLNSEINDSTTDIVLESANFQPENIRRSAKFLGLSTEASRRFERGMDPGFCMTALKKLCSLILSWSSGQLRSPFYNEFPKKPGIKKVILRTKRLNSVLGTRFSNSLIERSLKPLEITTNRGGDSRIQCTIPSFRFDLTREIDLIEEVSRIVGLDQIESGQRASISLRNVNNRQASALSKLRSYVTNFGFFEAYNYSMIDSNLKSKFPDRGRPIVLKNPISPEFGILRPSLVPGLLLAALHNRNRDVKNLRLFELGKIYAQSIFGKRGRREADSLAGVIYGRQTSPSWDSQVDLPVDIFTVKGIITDLLNKISLDIIEIIAYDNLYLENASSIQSGEKILGNFGQYRNNSLAISFNEPVFVFELDVEPVVEHMYNDRHYRPFSKYPPVKRELAFVIPDNLPVQVLLNDIKEISGSLLKSTSVEDIYRGSPIPENYRSVRISFKFSAEDRSLVDKDTESIIETIIKDMQSKHTIDIRR